MQKSATLLALLPLAGLVLVASSEAEGPLALRVGPLELEVDLGAACAPEPAPPAPPASSELPGPRALTREHVFILHADGEGTLPRAMHPRAVFVPGPDGGRWTVLAPAADPAS